MITIRKSNERGHANHGWLEAKHSFSFADYYDPDHMGFRALRVINEDKIKGGQGFGTHSHRDMEIVTYLIAGSLEHKDSIGTGSVIQPGDIQYMSAGSGVQHSEFNHSKSETAHLLQIWLLPNEKGVPPRYGQKSFTNEEKMGNLKLFASPDGRDGSISVRQDANIYVSALKPGQTTQHTLGKDRYGWIQVARGKLEVNGKPLEQGDGAAISDETRLEFKSLDSESEFLVFDLP